MVSKSCERTVQQGSWASFCVFALSWRFLANFCGIPLIPSSTFWPISSAKITLSFFLMLYGARLAGIITLLPSSTFIFRRFLVRVGVQPDSSGNCINFASDTHEDFEILDPFTAAPDFCVDSDFVLNVVTYTGGFVVRDVLKHETCSFCRVSLIDAVNRENRFFHLGHFLRLKNNGGLLMPSENVIFVLKATERLYRAIPDFKKDKACLIFTRLFEEIPENTFSSPHMLESGHRMKLIRSLVVSYVRIRSHHVARSRSSSHVTYRHRLTRSIIFRSE